MSKGKACDTLYAVLLLVILGHTAAARYSALSGRVNGVSSVKPTSSGYLQVDQDGSSIYYAFYESQAHAEDVGEAPIVFWLQGGPGCASTFGGFYELGPWSVTSDLGVQRNPGSWNRLFGLLLMDQPVGSGYSVAAGGNASIPRDEMGMAGHLYAALQAFFDQHHWLTPRPLFITGESYAGKYVPSIAHYILQAQADSASTTTTTTTTSATTTTTTQSAAEAASAPTPTPALQFRRPFPPGSGTAPPLFRLAGVAVGNGLTDPRAQTQTLASAAYYSGLLPPALRDEVAGRAAAVVALIDEGKWLEAHEQREALRSFITNVTGLGTMFDTRRTVDYDPTKSVDRFLNLPEVKEAMRARPDIRYQSCSELVGAAMSADVMRSVKYLLPDVLKHIPVLLYQGQYDILDGVASVSAWLASLEWDDQKDFSADRGRLWYLAAANNTGGGGGGSSRGVGGRGRGEDDPVVAGWWRSAGRLTHAVVYRAGHMVPHDQPLAAQQMIEHWVLGVLGGGGGGLRRGAADAAGDGGQKAAGRQSGGAWGAVAGIRAAGSS